MAEEKATIFNNKNKPAKPADASKPAEKKVKKKKGDKPALDATKIHVKLYSPFNIYFDDDALSISAENDTGPFDVLPQHHNFITLLNPCQILIRTDGGDKKVNISRGVMHVRDNSVTVFLDV